MWMIKLDLFITQNAKVGLKVNEKPLPSRAITQILKRTTCTFETGYCKFRMEERLVKHSKAHVNLVLVFVILVYILSVSEHCIRYTVAWILTSMRRILPTVSWVLLRRLPYFLSPSAPQKKLLLMIGDTASARCLYIP